MWLNPDEIEGAVVEELRKAGMLPTKASPALDVERFLERHLHVHLDQHADLPNGVLGLTEFTPGNQPRVLINRDLTGTALDDENPALGDLGRWRATLAHEAAHVLFHRALFDIDDMQRGLPGFSRTSDEPAAPASQVRCLKRSVGFGQRSTDWREVQANQGMAALLMPRRLFVEVCNEIHLSLEAHEAPSQPAAVALDERLVYELAKRFSVSRQAASIRLHGVRGSSSPAAEASLIL